MKKFAGMITKIIYVGVFVLCMFVLLSFVTKFNLKAAKEDRTGMYPSMNILKENVDE